MELGGHASISSLAGGPITHDATGFRCAPDGGILVDRLVVGDVCDVSAAGPGKGFVDLSLGALSTRVEIDVVAEAPTSLVVMDETGHALASVEIETRGAPTYYVAGELADGRRVLFDGVTITASGQCEAPSIRDDRFMISASVPGACELVARHGALEVHVPVTAR